MAGHQPGIEAGRNETDEIDFISAHGTGTLYNDEMEAKAIHLASMEKIPLNSLKGYYGHTLGAAGILESIITIHSMKENIIFPTFGFTTAGTEKPINIVKELRPAALRKCLKQPLVLGVAMQRLFWRKLKKVFGFRPYKR
jgi:3-oxoacyl-[acyl-carrier-protein] synthase-1